MALVIMSYLPVLLVHHAPWPALAAANGQCLVFRRRAYQAVGGHTALRDNILEDVHFARRIKAGGLRLRMADGAGLISCRMYRNWAAVRDGYAKNILAGYGNSIFFLTLAAVFHWLVFIAPWLWLVMPLEIYYSSDVAAATWPVWPLVLVGLGITIRMLSAAATRQRLGDALLLPLSVVLLTRIAAQALWWRWHGGPTWKGRVAAVDPITCPKP
jgi:chlorobactene glucosyltransferase